MKNNFKQRLKAVLMAFIFLGTLINTQAQSLIPERKISELPIIYMKEGVNLHIISPEPIQFVDLSTNELIGDLPAENIARIKINDGENLNDSIVIPKKKIKQYSELGIITVVGQSFMAQYRAVYQGKNIGITTNLQIEAEQMQPLEYQNIQFSNIELRNFANKIFQKKIKRPIREEKDLKLELCLNNVYVMSDYIFLDITFKNKSNLSYDIDAVKFSVEDKKIYKATNNQSIIIKPLFQLYNQVSFRKNFRNIYVFKKFTYPNSKVLNIRLLEKQLSGRTIELKVKYSDILNADTF
uniref:conjugative transposon protein TraN n=1 Tax=Ornithobacterium rhinotracheale TaxID=28251 RepID=UPI0021AABB51|nr:conjugative transposon protein TraN [Ornithobacterium rhinotracheale]